MSSTKEEEKLEVELTDFRADFAKPIEKPLIEFGCANHLSSNPSKERGYVKGLSVYGCECGAHRFALAWDDAMNAWVQHQTAHPAFKKLTEERGMAPERPPPSPHVILIDHEDAHLRTQRRWRARPTRPRCRAKFYLQSGPRSMPVQRLILPGPKDAVRFVNGNGLDLRRENLVRVTPKQIAAEMTAARVAQRKAAKEKKGPRKAVAKKAA